MQQNIGQSKAIDNALTIAMLCSFIFAWYVYTSNKQPITLSPPRTTYKATVLKPITVKEVPEYSRVEPLPVTAQQESPSSIPEQAIGVAVEETKLHTSTAKKPAPEHSKQLPFMQRILQNLLPIHLW